MTILFTLEYPPFRGGIANYYNNIVKYWPQEDKIIVLHNNEGQLLNSKWPVLKWWPAIKELYRATQEANKNSATQVLVGHVLPLGTVAYLISWLRPIEYSVFLHGMDLAFAQRSKRKKWLMKKILKRAQKIICNSSYVAKQAEEFMGRESAEKMVVVNPGVEQRLMVNGRLSTELIRKYNLKNKLVLLTVGRLVKRKGVDKVLECLPGVLKEVPNLVYVIVGAGEELSNCQLLMVNGQLEGSVLIITNANEDEKWAWYELCDIFIMPARNIKGDVEGFGIVYLEANLAGKPVIAGDSGGVRDAVEDGVSGLLINPEDINEIKNAIIKLAQDKNLRKKLGEESRARALKDFSWEKQTKKIYSIIN